jgi:hypothetical protein
LPENHPTLCFAPSGKVLSLACPRESTQRERHPMACPGINYDLCPDTLCFSGKPAPAQLAISLRSITLRQGASLIRFSLRCSAAPNRHPTPAACFVGALCKRDFFSSFWRRPGSSGIWQGRQIRAYRPKPCQAKPSIAAFSGVMRAALFELDLQAGRRGKSCEFGERLKWREAQGTRVSGQAFGSAFLLGTFLWRRKEKYLARKGETRRGMHHGKNITQSRWASRCSAQPTYLVLCAAAPLPEAARTGR